MTTSALRFARQLGITDPIVGYQGAIIRAVPPDGDARLGPAAGPPAAGPGAGPGGDRLLAGDRARAPHQPPRAVRDRGRRSGRRRLLEVPRRPGRLHRRPRRVGPAAGLEGDLRRPGTDRRRRPRGRPRAVRRPGGGDDQPPPLPRVPRPGRVEGRRDRVARAAGRRPDVGRARGRRPVQRPRDDRRGGPRGGDAARAGGGPGGRAVPGAAARRGGRRAADRGARPRRSAVRRHGRRALRGRGPPAPA